MPLCDWWMLVRCSFLKKKFVAGRSRAHALLLTSLALYQLHQRFSLREDCLRDKPLKNPRSLFFFFLSFFFFTRTVPEEWFGII